MELSEIVVPETKPETEWVRGRARRKMSPQRDHGRLQGKLFAMLDVWSLGRGEVATEWRFRVAPPGEALRPLVPDVAYVRAEALRGLPIDAIQIPAFAPTAVFEIVSPGDARADVASKTDVYLRAGTSLVVVIDPATREIELHDGESIVKLSSDDAFEHPVLPEFRFDVGAYFDAALRLIDEGPSPDRPASS